MSNSSARESPGAGTTTAGAEPPGHPAGSWWRRSLGGPLRAAGFWAAVGLPVAYLPLLLAGPGTATERRAVALLVAVHALALWLGRTHRRDAD